MKPWLKRSAMILGVCCVAFLLLESLLLLFNDSVFRSAFYVFDPDLGFRVRSYATYGNDKANEFGFNDRDYPHSRSDNTFRILFLGDSFNWMGGLEKNYTALVENLFEEKFGSGKVEVICGGYSQTHTGEQLTLLKKFGLLYNPDIVLLAVFAGNDFFDADPLRFRIAFGGGMTDVFAGRDYYAVILGQPLIFRSRLALYVQEKWRSRKRSLRSERNTSEAGSSEESTLEPVLTSIQPLNDYYLRSLYLRTQFNRPDHSGDFAPNVDLICDSVVAMQTLLSTRGVEFGVAVFPDEIQVDSNVRKAFLSHYQVDLSDFEWNRAQTILHELCSERGILIFDLYSEFLEATQSGAKLYLPNNGHWNDAGNELAAKYFFKTLDVKVRAALGLAQSGNQ